MIDSRLTNKEQYICYLLFILDPIIAWLGVPGNNAFVSMMFILAGMAYLPKRDFRLLLKSTPLVLWFFLTIYHWGNARNHGVAGVDFVDLLHGMKIYFCIAIFGFWAQVDFKGTVRIASKCLFLYLVVVFPLCMGGKRLSGVVYATQIGQTAAVATLLFAIYAYLKKYNYRRFFICVSWPLLVSFLTQSRNSVAMIVMTVVGFCLAQSIRNKISFNKIFKVSLLFLVVAVVGAFVFFNSSLYQRSLDVQAQNTASYYRKNNATNTIFDKIVGDRLIYYVEGWKFFKESPLTGIGMWGFRAKYGGNYPLHSEYMVHLCEGGVIAFSLWMLFILCCVKNVGRYGFDRALKLLLACGLIQFLFCGIYAREFFYQFFYPTIALFVVKPQKVEVQFENQTIKDI